MEFDLNGAEQPTDFVTVPQGVYLCEISDVRVGTTRAGDPRWGIRLIVAEGEYVGRQAAWDGLVFSVRGRARIRRILAALGMPDQGVVQISPDELRGRRAFVEIRPSQYTGSDGIAVRRNEVPYDGYRAVESDPNQGPRPSPNGRESDGSDVNGRELDGRDVDVNEIPF